MTRHHPVLALIVVSCMLIGSVGCDNSRRYDQAIAVLIDISGTYADEKGEVVRIIKREILPAMVPGDTLLVITIDSQSYEKDNLITLMTLDQRPSKANAQKLLVAKQLDVLAKSDARSSHTDILGAMMLGSEYLRELASGSRVMLIFSDMEQDLPAGVKRKTHETEFEDIRVLAMNVKRLQGDNIDPEGFRDRLSAWEKSVMAANAVGWQVMMDSTKLPKLLAQIR